MSRPPFDYDEIEAHAAERAVFASCARPVLVGELLSLPHSHADLARGAYALLVGGLLEDAPAAPAGAVPSPSATPQPTPTPPPPTTAEDAERTARFLLEKGSRQRAIDLLWESVERHPDAAGPRRLLAMTLARQGRFHAEVEKLFLAALEKEPLDVDLRYALASYYRRAGMAARAVLHLKLVLSADSAHAGAWRDLGELEAGESRRGR